MIGGLLCTFIGAYITGVSRGATMLTIFAAYGILFGTATERTASIRTARFTISTCMLIITADNFT
jgi:hypothetical protein